MNTCIHIHMNMNTNRDIGAFMCHSGTTYLYVLAYVSRCAQRKHMNTCVQL